MSSNAHLKDRAIQLRRVGKSYSEILKELKLTSKGTLSFWLKNLDLSLKSKRLLERNNNLAIERGLHKFNSERSKKIIEENENSKREGQQQIGRLTPRELLLVGAALYWGEGSKSERGNSCRTANFANSDPDMIVLFLKFVREVLKVKEEKIRAGIHIYPSIVREEAIKFWSGVTKLPLDRFYVVTQISRASQNKRPYNSLPYGTVAIKIHDRKLFFKIKGMIQGLATNRK